MKYLLIVTLLILTNWASATENELNIDNIKEQSSEQRRIEDTCVFDKLIKTFNGKIKKNAANGLFEARTSLHVDFEYEKWPDCIKLASCDSKSICIKKSKDGLCLDYKSIKTNCSAEVKSKYSVVSYYLNKGFRVFLDSSHHGGFEEWHYDNFFNGYIGLRDIVKKDYDESSFKKFIIEQKSTYDIRHSKNHSIDEIYDFYLDTTRQELLGANDIMVKW